MELARNKFPGTSNSLMLFVKDLILIYQRTKHNAMLDCELLREVYINSDAKEPKFNLSSNINELRLTRNQGYNKKVLDISEEEIKKHKEFLKKSSKKLY